MGEVWIALLKLSPVKVDQLVKLRFPDTRAVQPSRRVHLAFSDPSATVDLPDLRHSRCTRARPMQFTYRWMSARVRPGL